MDIFLQEHGKTIFIAVCILLLVGPIISDAIKGIVNSYAGSVTFNSVAGKIS